MNDWENQRNKCHRSSTMSQRPTYNKYALKWTQMNVRMKIHVQCALWITRSINMIVANDREQSRPNNTHTHIQLEWTCPRLEFVIKFSFQTQCRTPFSSILRLHTTMAHTDLCSVPQNLKYAWNGKHTHTHARARAHAHSNINIYQTHSLTSSSWAE